jgi:hypothetical protein
MGGFLARRCWLDLRPWRDRYTWLRGQLDPIECIARHWQKEIQISIFRSPAKLLYSNHFLNYG